MKIYLFTRTATLSKVSAAILFLIAFPLIITAQIKSCGEKDYECQAAAATNTIRASPNEASGYQTRGNAYYNNGQYDLAAADYTKVLEIEPQNGEIYSYRGDAFYFLKSYDRAIENYNTALGFDFQNAEMLVRLGNSYDISDKFDAAMKAYNQAIRLDPNSASAYYNRGIALLNKDKNKPAIEDFQKALKVNPDFDAAKKYLEMAQTAKQEKDARTKEKWANFGKAIDQIANQTQTQSSGGSSSQPNTSGSNGGNSAGSSGGLSSGLTAGTYSCFTTVSIYAGRGGSGAYTYPIYNSSRQTRGSIRINSDGTYRLDDGTVLHYSFNGGAIRWLDGTFAEASSSSLISDAQGNPNIRIKFNGDKDVWDCTKQ